LFLSVGVMVAGALTPVYNYMEATLKHLSQPETERNERNAAT
jgi:hypothetical protein